MDNHFSENTADSYNRVAKDYAEKFGDELNAKPFDRKMLDLLIEKCGLDAVLCDLGCGPGHLAAYLHKQGAKVMGIDLSHEMVKVAQTSNPAIPFQSGDMLHLEAIPSQELGGVAAFYAIIHIPPVHVVSALKEIWRVLQPQGSLLLTFHIGEEIRHFETWFEQRVNLDFYFFTMAEMRGYLEAAGFVIDEVIERSPYPIEVPTQRAYIFAHKPVL